MIIAVGSPDSPPQRLFWKFKELADLKLMLTPTESLFLHFDEAPCCPYRMPSSFPNLTEDAHLPEKTRFAENNFDLKA